MRLDPEWAPFLTVLVPIVVAALGVLTARVAGKANVKSKEVEATADLFAEYRELKNEIKKDLVAEREAREEFERQMTARFDEVVSHFGIYVDWARAGAKPPPPFIPDWIYQRINQLRHLPTE